MSEEKGEKECYSESIKLLARKDYSVFKLTKKLEEKEFNLEVIQNVIEILKEKRFLREDEYTRSRVKAFIRKGYSKRYIELKLKQEGLNDVRGIIDEQFLEQNITENDQINILVSKKNQNDEIKLKRFLMSKGHFNLE